MGQELEKSIANYKTTVGFLNLIMTRVSAYFFSSVMFGVAATLNGQAESGDLFSRISSMVFFLIGLLVVALIVRGSFQMGIIASEFVLNCFPEVHGSKTQTWIFAVFWIFRLWILIVLLFVEFHVFTGSAKILLSAFGSGLNISHEHFGVGFTFSSSNEGALSQ